MRVSIGSTGGDRQDDAQLGEHKIAAGTALDAFAWSGPDAAGRLRNLLSERLTGGVREPSVAMLRSNRADRKGNFMISVKRFGTAVLAAFAVISLAMVGHAQQIGAADDFVLRKGTSLTLSGRPFRYSGPNLEWLGLEGYGAFSKAGPQMPTHFEIDDAFATAAEMGAKVVRSQTMGDSIGCGQCIEPAEGQFNEAAFQSSDYALAVARKYKMKVIITLIGDCASCQGGGVGQYLTWEGRRDAIDFFTVPSLITAFEKHIAAVLNHKNPSTGLRYKDDPTIMAWENCNMCGIHPLLADKVGTAGGRIADWVETIGNFIKNVDPHHLYLDTSGIFSKYPAVIGAKSTDIVTYEYYPHWNAVLGPIHMVNAGIFSSDAALITGKGKAYILNEYGWDKTDWQSDEDFGSVLDQLESNAEISGDNFWALQAHADGFGFQPIPADSENPIYAREGESGQWWSLYYPGVANRVMSSNEMSSRAQQLRTHAFKMAGLPVPPHNVPPPPVVTSVVENWLVAFRGSAGAVNYSIQQQAAGSAEWKTICERCARDTDDPWVNPNGPAFGAHYRVIAWNADGVPSQPSAPW